MSMGLQIQSHSNGSSSTDPASSDNRKDTTGENGSTSAPISSIRQIKLDGKLMYEDDRDWAEYQNASTNGTGEGAAEGSEDGIRRAKTALINGKRMPVDREEVVRLILQGLRDIGYE
jgi:hypothetical protein